MKKVWSLVKFPLEGWIIYKISELLETIATKGGLSRFQEKDMIHSLYDKVDDIARILLVSLMIIYYVRKWSYKNKEKWSSDRSESIAWAVFGIPVLSILAGIIDRIFLCIWPMLRLNGKIDSSINTIKRPIETIILALIFMALIELRYSIFKWLERKNWIGIIGFIIFFVIVNVILHCVSFGLFHLIYETIVNALVDVLVKIIAVCILCPGLLAAVYIAWPVSSK